MSLFQNSVLNKYLKGLESEKVNEAYHRFISHFHNPTIQENIRNSKEEQYQGEFLIDLFVTVFGYTKNPAPNFNLTTELKNIKGSKKTDGAILSIDKSDTSRDLSPLAKAVIELKGTNTTDLSKVEAQAFGYKNNQPGCNYVITSNFEKLRFYIDNAVDFEEFNLFQLSKERFEILWLCLSSEYLLKDIPKKIKDESLTQEENVTKKLYKDYASFRNEIFDAIQKENPEYDKLTLFKKTQKLLDRFLFIFFAEDRLLLPPNSIRAIVNQWTDLRDKYDEYFPLYDRFKKYFGYMNTGHKGQQHDIFAYNGGLFAPDDILDNIKINDDLLHKHTLNLSNYDFESEVSVNILGHIFEHSLNDIDEIQNNLNGLKSVGKRKKDGVFYTPKYITKYIVDNTVGKLCEEKKAELDIHEADYEKERKGRQKVTLKKLNQKLEDYRKWLLQITICDPACGSGAFLNQALEFLIAEHRYIDELQAKLFGDAMVLSDIENAILENNLFGVDINEESVEIAKLSLWLRTAQKGRKLTTLNNNIKCGNSLIDDPTVAGDKAFNWQNEFPDVFKEKDKKAYHITTAIHDSRTSARMKKYKVREQRDGGTNPYPNVIYFTPEDDLIITQTIADIVEEDKLNLLAYNICAEHIHLLVVCDLQDIPSIMQKIKGRTSYHKGLNHKELNHKGLKSLDKEKNKPLWSQKYSAPKEVTTQEQLYNTIRYIQTNRNKHELPPHNKKLQNLIDTMCCSIDKAFTPEYTGGFDVVIGNPPYVLCQPSNTIETVLDFYKKFQVASYKIDLFHLFFEKSIEYLKLNGKLGFITPNTYLNNKYIKPLRSFILEETSVNILINYKDQIFADAGVDVATIILTKGKIDYNKITLIEVENSIEKQLGQKLQSLWSKDKDKIFNLNKEFAIKFDNCVPLNEICTSYFGIQAYDRKSTISIDEVDDNHLPIIDGGDINSFSYSLPTKYFNFLPEKIKSGGNFNVYNEKRIVISQIGFTPIVGICEKGILGSNTLYNINLKPNSKFNLYFLLSILNSSLLKAYWVSKYSDGKKLFPKIKGFQLKELPIKVVAEEFQLPFVDKAENLLSFNSNLQKLRNALINLVLNKFNIEKPSKKLQNWHELDFGEFLKELESARKKATMSTDLSPLDAYAKLSLNEEAEWMQYFNEQKQKAEELKAEIEKTDKAIDQMVYELYGLTEEEIAIVEEATK
ncbi:MAG: TaqI-like C-terminal specificity domain-containing protein [Flavobacteriaceae bacterium]